jgi:PEP-CTERM motif
MKRSVLVFALLVVAAPVAHAFVQPGHLPQTPIGSTTRVGGSSGIQHNTSPGIGVAGQVRHEMPAAGSGTDPVNPVPEPGTMALASMGLMALGAAARKRRGK